MKGRSFWIKHLNYRTFSQEFLIGNPSLKLQKRHKAFTWRGVRAAWACKSQNNLYVSDAAEI